MSGPLLDRFIPHPDISERFEITIDAPAELVMDVAVNFDMQSPPLVKAIFRLREVIMQSGRDAARQPRGMLEETKALGWGILDEQPGRFVICGAKCQPWLTDVRFSSIAPDAFATYAEPDQVKIAWTLEATELGATSTRFAQETRAVATDEASRTKFRRYWRWARFGIVAIRVLLLPAVRRAAEQRWAIVRNKK